MTKLFSYTQVEEANKSRPKPSRSLLPLPSGVWQFVIVSAMLERSIPTELIQVKKKQSICIDRHSSGYIREKSRWLSFSQLLYLMAAQCTAVQSRFLTQSSLGAFNRGKWLLVPTAIVKLPSGVWQFAIVSAILERSISMELIQVKKKRSICIDRYSSGCIRKKSHQLSFSQFLYLMAA